METNKNELMNGTTVISDGQSSEKIYTDDKERTVIQELLVGLKPIEKPLRNALNREGVNADKMSFENVVTVFYNKFVKDANQPDLPVTYLSDHPMSNVKVSNFDTDHLDSIAVASAVVSGVKDVAASIRNKAKAKKAQKIADAGNYASLTPFQKSLINVPAYVNSAPLTKNEQALANDVDKVVTKLEDKQKGELSVTETNLKKYIIIGVVLIVIAIAVYLFMKKK